MSSKPVSEIRLGRIKAAIFDNGEEVPNRVTFSRLYKDGDSWKSTTSFVREDLPLLVKVADRVHSRLYE